VWVKNSQKKKNWDSKKRHVVDYVKSEVANLLGSRKVSRNKKGRGPEKKVSAITEGRDGLKTSNGTAWGKGPLRGGCRSEKDSHKPKTCLWNTKVTTTKRTFRG